MADYERSETVAVPAGTLFAYLSDIANLPRYFARMTSAEPAGGEAIHTTAVIDVGEGPQEVEGEAWFRVHEDERRLEWGSEGPNDYRGELDVTDDGDVSTVAVRLHTRSDDVAAIEDGLKDTLAGIKRLVEQG